MSKFLAAIGLGFVTLLALVLVIGSWVRDQASHDTGDRRVVLALVSIATGLMLIVVGVVSGTLPFLLHRVFA